jgi:uncharacterized protein (TIGR02677 family)
MSIIDAVGEVRMTPEELGRRVTSSAPAKVAPVETEPGSFKPFVHLTVPNAPLYRRVMVAFVAAKRRFVVHLRTEDVLDALGRTAPDSHAPASNSDLVRTDQRSAPPDDADAIADALARLVEWGNLRADPDTSRVTTVEDFHRARYLHQLTKEGEAAERALEVFDEEIGRRGALQAVALTDIATGLRALSELARHEDPDPARTALLLRDLVARCRELADNAQAFMGSLQRTIDLHDIDIEAFRAYKDRLIDYLERFIKDLIGVGAEIALLLTELEPKDVDRLLRIVARREAEDAAPDAGPGAPDAREAYEAAHHAGLEAWRERWDGLLQWFVSEPGHPSQAKLLRGRARQAIPDLLAVVASLNERRAGRSDRSADFRTLAAWFAEAPDASAMHRLWRASFGMHSTRHLALDVDTITARKQRPVSAGTSWLDAPPLLISPRLRRTGSYERRGHPTRVIGREEGRRLLADRVSQEAEQTAAARALLATGHPVRFSQLGELDADTFPLFLALLSDALSARRPGEREVRVTTADGSLGVHLIALPNPAWVEIRTSTGSFRGLDHLIEIVDLAANAGGLQSTPTRLVA